MSRPAAAVAIVVTWLAAVVPTLCHDIPNPTQVLAPFTLIVALAGTYSAVLRGLERLRLAAAPGQHQDVMTTWIVAAGILLPPLAAAAAITVIYAIWLPTWRGMGRWRTTFVISTTLVAGDFGRWIYLGGGGSIRALVLAGLTSVLLQAVLVAVVMCLTGGAGAARASFSSPVNWMINLSTGAVGITLVDTIHSARWWALPLVLVAKFLLQWLAAQLQLNSGDAIDEQTGLLAESTWKRLADQLMRSTQRWTVIVLEPMDPSRLATVADIAALTCGDGEPGGRLDASQIGLMVRGAPVVARNVALRIQHDLDALDVPTMIGLGAGDSLDEQLETAQLNALVGLSMI